MTRADFSTFYQAIHGYPPFPWQQRLLDRVSHSGWPETISLPTSSGKTSVIDVAVFHLALEAGKSALERRAPLRIFFVIDRRVVVDEAAEHAFKLAKELIQSENAAVRQVAEALRSFGAAYPLDVAVLRGGMHRDNTWADEPNQPLVCVSTVDQIGSRLLFRGYQVSDEAKPVHAGFVGNDSLIVVDEAHLSAPFLDTVAAVRRRGEGERQICRGIAVVKMSATQEDSGYVFPLEEDDYATPELMVRLSASKPTQLRIPAKGFEEELARSAKELAELPGVAVVGVVVNTVASARSVFEDLRRLKGSEAVLLTGRNRPYRSAELWEEYKDRIAAKKGRVSKGKLFVVATQTVEVGANIDFDALVSESAPIDALRQRFGRLNRLGREGETPAILVRRPKEDPVYGEATGRSWEFLEGLEKVDFGVLAMDNALKGAPVELLVKKGERGPLVLGKHLEIWAQTKPIPDPDPDVAPFLHGKDALEDADIQVVWREDLLEDGKAEEWQTAVELAPPVAMESLALPLGTLRRWLRGETKLSVSDVEGSPQEVDDVRKPARKILIWHGKKVDTPVTDLRRIRPGDVVVVPSSYGGCDRFGWNPGSGEPVEDLGDLANNKMAAVGLRRFRIRLGLAVKSFEGDHKAEFAELVQQIQKPSDDVDTEARNKIIDMLNKHPDWKDEPLRIDLSGRLAIAMKMWPKPGRQIPGLLKPEDLDDDSVGLQAPILLKDHVAGVVEHTERYAKHCGLDADLVSDLVTAAELHDLGKWDERFQAWLCGKSVAGRAQLDEPLAKSGATHGETLQERRAARRLAEYPDRARHEAASVLLACATGRLSGAHDQDLVLHLIGAHHGYGRPLMPVWEEDEGQTVAAQVGGTWLETGTGNRVGRFDSGWVDRFERLNRRYGYWGLAYLETILRRADCVQSRKEQET